MDLLDQFTHTLQGLYSLSGKTSYRQISWSLEAARSDVIMIVLQRCYRAACQISERLEKYNPIFCTFKSSQNIAVRRPSA